MKTSYRLDKAFGPAGASAGIFMVIAGLGATYTSPYGLILAALGAFIGFTSSRTTVDYGRKRIKLSNCLWGVLSIGSWVAVEPSMKVSVRRSNMTWRTYSQSNQTLDIACNDYRIILLDSNKNELMPIKKMDSLDAAKVEMEKISNLLGLSVA